MSLDELLAVVLSFRESFKVFSLCDSSSEIMYEVLDESLRRAEMNHNITYGRQI